MKDGGEISNCLPVSEPNVQTKCGFQSIPDSNLGAGFMTVPGQYDTVPPARITGMAQTGASVKYNMPDNEQHGAESQKTQSQACRTICQCGRTICTNCRRQRRSSTNYWCQ